MDAKQTKQLIRKFFATRYETTSATELRNDHGVKAGMSKDRVDDVVVGTSYFYRSQNHTAAFVKEFTEFCKGEGVEVTVVSDIEFKTKDWPNTSWAEQTVRLSK